jgi:hypothetical protein
LSEVGFASTIPYQHSRSADGGRLLIDGVDVRAEDVTGDASLALDGDRQLGRNRLVKLEPVENRRLIATNQLAE